MPTFFDAMKRIVQGKTVYDPNDPTPAEPLQDMPTPDEIQNPLQEGELQPLQPNTESTSEEPTILSSDPGTFPVASVKRTMTRINGEDMQVYCYIQNNSNQLIELHKIRVFDREEELRHALNPGGDREFLVYEGPCLKSQQDHQALLIYRTENGNYFEALHEIRFRYNSNDQTYSVDEMHLHLPIRMMHR